MSVEGVGVVGTQHPHLILKECFEGCGGSLRVPGLAPPSCEVVAGGEGVGVVGAQGVEAALVEVLEMPDCFVDQAVLAQAVALQGQDHVRFGFEECVLGVGAQTRHIGAQHGTVRGIVLDLGPDLVEGVRVESGAGFKCGLVEPVAADALDQGMDTNGGAVVVDQAQPVQPRQDLADRPPRDESGIGIGGPVSVVGRIVLVDRVVRVGW